MQDICADQCPECAHLYGRQGENGKVYGGKCSRFAESEAKAHYSHCHKGSCRNNRHCKSCGVKAEDQKREFENEDHSRSQKRDDAQHKA